MSTFKDFYLSDERGRALHATRDRVNTQLAAARGDLDQLEAVVAEMLVLLRSGGDSARILVALELPVVREMRDRARGKVEKLVREADEARERLENFNLLRRSVT